MSDDEQRALLKCVKMKCGNHNLACMSIASYQQDAKVLKELIVADAEYANDFDSSFASELCTMMGKQFDSLEESDRPAVVQKHTRERSKRRKMLIGRK